MGETLPLFASVLLSTPYAPARDTLVRISPEGIPARPLKPEEQYRFHFDMTRCIGCKCCVVACNEQNGNPAGINWRRVGEVEGGYYPFTQRHYLSMGCNHCLEPSCLTGCPTEAYHKDLATGIVHHSAEACIGCQYCTWNCSYGVPQYNPERGVVGKCDMCHHRLFDGMAPACASACPEGAIAIEIVNTREWRANHVAANAPGLPSSGDSISTTRITLPRDLAPDTSRVDTGRMVLEEAHWPLVFMLVLTQLSIGAFAVLWLLDLFAGGGNVSQPALLSLAMAGMSLGASTLHLGRPAYAWRALRGWRRSWLSREVFLLSAFAAAASVDCGLSFLHLGLRAWIGSAALLAGISGIFCSARIYTVRARPAWYSSYTLAEFFATVLLLGPLFVRASLPQAPPWMGWAAAGGAAAQLLTAALKFFWLSQAELFELRASARLLSGRLRGFFLSRLALLVAGGLVIPLAWNGRAAAIGAFAAVLAGEWLGRWLFFVSVVPKTMAAAFGEARKAA